MSGEYQFDRAYRRPRRRPCEAAFWKLRISLRRCRSESTLLVAHRYEVDGPCRCRSRIDVDRGMLMRRERIWRRETPGPKTLDGQDGERESTRGENISKLGATLDVSTLGCLSQVEAATRRLGVLNLNSSDQPKERENQLGLRLRRSLSELRSGGAADSYSYIITRRIGWNSADIPPSPDGNEMPILDMGRRPVIGLSAASPPTLQQAPTTSDPPPVEGTALAIDFCRALDMDLKSSQVMLPLPYSYRLPRTLPRARPLLVPNICL